MDLNSINANINRLLTNIWAVISFLKEFAVDGAKDVSITYINADGSESVKTIPNISKMFSGQKGTFTATIYGKSGSTTDGTDWSKNITGYYHLVNDRCFIDFTDSLFDGTDGDELGFFKITGLPFVADEHSFNGVVFGRGTQWKYGTVTRDTFMTRCRILSGTSEIIIDCEATDTPYSGWLSLRTNDTASRIASLSIDYKIVGV